MNLWLVTSIRLDPATPLRASSIQNLQTAMALADLGHRVLLWVAQAGPDAPALIEERLGRPLPAGLKLLTYTPQGPRDEKKTPFYTVRARLYNIARAHLGTPPPDVIITRSPRIIAQLRDSRLVPDAARLVLEYQYPEWAQLWREWHHRRPNAPLREAVDHLRAWRQREDEWLLMADGIFYAARGHELLLRRAGVKSPVRWVPSGCLPPEGEAKDRTDSTDRTEPSDAQAKTGDPQGPLAAGAGGADETSALPVLNPQSAPSFDLGYIGALAPENGLEMLLDALAELPGVKLLLVGGGREGYVTQLKAQAERLALADRITFAGPVKFHEVRPLMRRCRVGVVPISRRQGPEKRQFSSPLKLIEWMGAGVPVVATAVPSVCQFATDGRDCLMVPPEVPGALATAVWRLLIDPELAASLAREGLSAAGAAAWPHRARLIADFLQALPAAQA